MADPALAPVRSADDEDRTVAARKKMVAELESAGRLLPGPVRDAFVALRREVLMPQAYVRRSDPAETPPRWDLLDWNLPTDQEELLGLLYGGESVLVQHEGEPILGRVPGPRSGGSMTAMSSTVGMTVGLLHRLGLQTGQRVLDIGTWAGVTAAVACMVAGDAGVVTVDRDPHVTAAARERLATLGHRPVAVTGDGQHGWLPRAPYDRIFVSYAVPCVPAAWPEQLAGGGLALASLATSSPSWPGLAVITKTADDRVEARLEAVKLGHRLGDGGKQLFLNAPFRERIAVGDGSMHSTRTSPPADEARGMWLALDHLHPVWFATGPPTTWSSAPPNAGPGSASVRTAEAGGR